MHPAQWGTLHNTRPAFFPSGSIHAYTTLLQAFIRSTMGPIDVIALTNAQFFITCGVKESVNKAVSFCHSPSSLMEW